jgi:hypothetical protein
MTSTSANLRDGRHLFIALARAHTRARAHWELMRTVAEVRGGWRTDSEGACDAD